MKKNLNRKLKTNKAFTMIEMLIVVAIVGIMTSIIVWNYGDFRSGIVTTNMAYEAATSVRQAQLYGLGVRASGAPGGTQEFGGTYGVEFHLDESVYTLFHDAGDTINPPSGLCDSPCDCSDNASECVERVTMLQEITISKVCAANSVVSQEDLLQSHCNFDTLTVTYTRPHPESLIQAGSSGGVNGTEFAIGGVVVMGGKHCRLVTIYQSGQVSVAGLPESACSQG